MILTKSNRNVRMDIDGDIVRRKDSKKEETSDTKMSVIEHETTESRSEIEEIQGRRKGIETMTMIGKTGEKRRGKGSSLRLLGLNPSHWVPPLSQRQKQLSQHSGLIHSHIHQDDNPSQNSCSDSFNIRAAGRLMCKAAYSYVILDVMLQNSKKPRCNGHHVICLKKDAWVGASQQSFQLKLRC